MTSEVMKVGANTNDDGTRRRGTDRKDWSSILGGGVGAGPGKGGGALSL